MRKILVPLLLVLTLTFPVFAQAQDTAEPPTQEVATLEATQTADVVTATPNPEVTAEPSPVPEPPVPPIDQTKVFESVYSVALALVVGAVAIALTGIVGALLLLAPAFRAIVMSGIKTGIDEAGKIAEKTETPLDDLGVAELRKLYLLIEKRLSEAEQQVNTNTTDIAVQSQQLGNR